MEEEESDQLPRGSDTDLASYQEQLEEATAALLRAGQYLEAETGKRQSKYRNSREESKKEEDKGSGLYMPMVGASSTDKEEPAEDGEDATAEEKKDLQMREGREEDRRETSLLSTVGLDWLFSDSEPEQPPGSPKPVEKSTLRSRSESPKSGSSPQALEGESREPRDSSHGSSGTDTETRYFLETSIEANLEPCCPGPC